MPTIENFDSLQVVNTKNAILWQYDSAPNISSLFDLEYDWLQSRGAAFWDWYINKYFTLGLDTSPEGVIIWSILLDYGVVSAAPPILADSWGFGTGNENFQNAGFGSKNGAVVNLPLPYAIMALKLRYFDLVTSGAVTQINAFMKYLFGTVAGQTSTYVVLPELDLNGITNAGVVKSVGINIGGFLPDDILSFDYLNGLYQATDFDVDNPGAYKNTALKITSNTLVLSVVSMVRDSGLVTIKTSAPHNLSGAYNYIVTVNGASFGDGEHYVNIASADTLTYSDAASNETATGTITLTDITRGYGYYGNFTTVDAALAAAQAAGTVIVPSNDTSYTFWIYDYDPSNNGNGLSMKINRTIVWPEHPKVYVVDNHDMTMTYVFNFQPDQFLRYMLEVMDLFPRPSGVKSNWVYIP